MTGGAFMVAAGLAGFRLYRACRRDSRNLVLRAPAGRRVRNIWPFASRRIIEAAPAGERDIAASAFSTLQRLGYAIGCRACGDDRQCQRFFRGFYARGGRRERRRFCSSPSCPWPFSAALPPGDWQLPLRQILPEPASPLFLPCFQTTFAIVRPAMVKTSEMVCCESVGSGK